MNYKSNSFQFFLNWLLMAADDMINTLFHGKLSDLPDEEMGQLTIPRGNCKRSSQNVPIFSFLWQGSCTYGQVVDD